MAEPTTTTTDLHYHSLDIATVLQTLRTDPSTGLTKDEAQHRLLTHGPNQLPTERSKTVWEKLWAQINSVLIYVLLIGAALSFGFEHYADGFVILGVIIVNVFLGYFMEDQAENSTKKLKSLLSPTAIAIRDSEKSQIDASTLTIGDIFELQAGDVVPADGRVIREVDLHTLEAPLTGEAHAVKKTKDPVSKPDTPLAERTSMVYSGTQVIKGTAICVATAIGSECEIGLINSLLRNVEETKTPLVLQLEIFGYYLSAAILIISVIALVVAFGRGYDVADAFSFAIGICVAAIPEGLPSVVTITFSIGVYMMAKNKAIVKTLPAVEALGSVSVICSDKTGTLTLNKMTVKVVVTKEKKINLADDGKIVQMTETADGGALIEHVAANNYLPLLVPGIFCNDSMIKSNNPMIEGGSGGRGDEGDIEMGNSHNPTHTAHTVEGDPTEACIMTLGGHWMPFTEMKRWLKDLNRVDVFPFDSANKYMATLHAVPAHVPSSFPSDRYLSQSGESKPSGDKKLVFLKGAPERVVNFCDFDSPNDAQYWREQAHSLAAKGMRVIGLAFRLVDSSYDFQEEMAAPKGLTLVSLVGITDPPRPDAIVAIEHAQHAGIIVKMITGDHPVTAVAIANQLGIQHNQRAREMQAALKAAIADASKEGVDGSAIVDEEEIELDDRYSIKEPQLKAIVGTELDQMLQEEENEQQALRSAEAATDAGDVTYPRSTTSRFAKTVARYDVFARTTPEQKLRIVQSLQAQGYVCSMTGDGVNDSPALKAASIGVAMGITGTEVAKDAAKIILLDDNFKTIVEAIRLGRCTYQNLIKILTFVLPTNGAQAFCIVAALIIGFEVPITALQILWVNMVTSITLGLVLAFEPIDDRVMAHPPRKTGKQIFGKFLRYRILFIATIFVIIVLGTLEWEKIYRDIRDVDELRTIAVNTLSACQAGYLFNCRVLRQNDTLWNTFTGNWVIYVGIGFVAGFQAMFTYAPFMQFVFATKPIDGVAWGKIIMWGVIVFVIVETEKSLTPYWHNYWYGSKPKYVPVKQDRNSLEHV